MKPASAGNRTWINCLEGSYADHYTTDAFHSSLCSYFLIQIRNCSCSLYYWKLLFEIIEMIYGRHYGDIKN